MTPPLSRDELAEMYLAQLPYAPYPVQEDAILSWFTSEQGSLVCAPTGTGKTLIAEAALFEALHSNQIAYYTTPLIALTEQKFQEMRAAATRWGFSANDVGLITGNRSVNPRARIRVVVAEILLNRLLHQEAFDFEHVAAVVMDEFHNFADRERGMVWELSLALLPKHIRLLLLSATVGNARDFLDWLSKSHARKLDRVEGTERKVPLAYHWVPDELLPEHLTAMAEGSEATRRTPALVFCFNRDWCWSTAEQLKGCKLLDEPTRATLLAELNELDWSFGAGTKLKQLLNRGIGVHHAGVLPKYKRVVESLFQRKLLPILVCTETLAAGINLPARSVVLTTLVKGPRGEEKLLDSSTAHQIFGRAGRPQFDTQGFVYALAHEDDVRILRWRQKYDAIPEDTKDPGLLRAKKALKKKRPTRRETQVYWNDAQFEKLKTAPPAKLYSKGPLPWRLLAYLLKLSPEVARIREFIRKRFMDEPRLNAAVKDLERMLIILDAAGYVHLEPRPPVVEKETDASLMAAALARVGGQKAQAFDPPPAYHAELATPTPLHERLLAFRSVNPLYGGFLLDQLGAADPEERIQALESVLELPGAVLKHVRPPRDMPPGKLAQESLDAALIARGLIAAPLGPDEEEEDDGFDKEPWENRPPAFAEKLQLLFDSLYPGVEGIETRAVWAAPVLFEFNGNFNNFVKARDLTKQEGLIFRHFLRLILLCEEFAQHAPTGMDAEAWRAELRGLSDRLTEACRAVDPTSTEDAIAQAHATDLLEVEARDKSDLTPESSG